MKLATIEHAVSLIKDGMTVMVGGFLTNGTPLDILDALSNSAVKDLTIISNDAGLPGKGVGKLLDAGCIKKLIVSHIGLNPDAGIAMNAGSVEVDLVPQGTLAERIRAGGSGLGGFLTPTGVNTIVEQGKQKLNLDGRDYLLELPLKADFALICGYQVDKGGNVFYRGSTRNFNPLMATAAGIVIVEADILVDEIAPDTVHTPGIFVDYVVKGSAK